MIRLLLVAALCIISVHSLASKSNFNRHFDRCIETFSRQSNRPTTFGEVLPAGMTMNSLIDKIDKLESRIFKGQQPSAQKTALILLHWFSVPDITWVQQNNRFEQSENHRFRYEFIERLFADEFGEISTIDFERILEDSATSIYNEQDDMCFMMRALSPTVYITCPTEEKQRLLPVQDTRIDNNINPNSYRDRDAIRRPAPSQESMRNRGRPASRQNYPQVAVGAVPNVRESQVNLLHGANLNPKMGCIFREDGVVSLTGRPQDAIAVAPILLGIAASKLPTGNIYLFSPSDKLYDKDNSHTPMDPLVMSTLGQQIGYAAFMKKLDERSAGTLVSQLEVGNKGFWNQSGCLVNFQLDNKAAKRIVLTQAQIDGSIDGFILGTALRNDIVSEISLADLLRLYYSNNNLNFAQNQARLSVCYRDETFTTLRTEDITTQSRLMTFGLALKDGQTFYPSDWGDAILSFDNSEISSYVSTILSQLKYDESVRELRKSFCTATQSQDQCASPSDVHVILDPSVMSFSVLLNRQANILGRILNGFDFRVRRNAVRVYAGRSGSSLMQIPDRLTNITGSGCAACIAQYLARFRNDGYSVEGEEGIFTALNETLKQFAQQDLQQRKISTSGRTILFFRMSHDPIKDTGAPIDAILRFRISNPDVKIIAIGEKEILQQLYDRTGAFQFYDAEELEKEIASNQYDNLQSKFAEIQLSICETGVNLKNILCNPNVTPNSELARNQRPSNDRNGRGGSEFEGGVNPRHVQYVTYDTVQFSESYDMRVKFTAGSKGHIKVCDAASGYDYSTTNNQANVILDEDDKDVREGRRPIICQQTSDQMKSIYFNYSSPCIDGPRSCAALRYAVVGVPLDTRSRPSSRDCRSVFCELPLSIPYTVNPENMRCGASSSTLSGSILLIIAAVLFVRNNP